MARRRPITQEMPDAVREAVDRTVQATIGSAQQGRGRAQDAVDELVRTAEAGAGAVRERVRTAEAGAGAVRERVRGALGDRRPATSEDLRELRRELEKIGRRLGAIELRLDAGGAKGAGGKRGQGRSAVAGAGTASRAGGAKGKGGTGGRRASKAKGEGASGRGGAARGRGSGGARGAS
jgi:hypothetical protein